MFSTTTKVYRPRHRALMVAGGGLALAVVCAACVSRLRFWGVTPDWFVLYSLFFAMFGNERGRYMPSMILGFIRDCFSAGPFGTYAIIYGALHRVIAPRRTMVFRENPLVLAIVAFFAVAASNMAYHAALVFTGCGIGWYDAAIVAIKTAAVTAPAMPVLVWAMKIVMGRTGIEKIPGGDYNM